MKRLLCCAISALLLLTCTAHGEESVHLQVIGETDLYEDQQYKLLIRDMTLDYIENHGIEDLEGLEAYLNQLSTDFGRSSFISVERGIFPYPSGEYDVVRIFIGRAEGRNWWGVLYPEHSGLDSDVIYYSALVNWLMHLIGIE